MTILDATQSSELMTYHLSGSEVLAELVKDILSKGVECRFQAKGHSMSPFIKDGDVVTVSPLFGTAPHLGDVVAFIHPGTDKLVIHRVVGRKDDSCIIIGDNTFETNGPVSTGNILGRVTRVERGGKRIIVGLGLERYLIAFLSRSGLLSSVLPPIWSLLRPFLRRRVR
jgi:hypothetical protein